LKTGDDVKGSKTKESEREDKEQYRLSEISEFRKWQNQTKSSTISKYGLNKEILCVRRLSSILDLSKKERSHAEKICIEGKLARIFSRQQSKTIAAAAVYASCRIYQIPSSLSEISRITTVNELELRHLYKIMVIKLKLKIPVPEISRYIERISQSISLHHRTYSKAIELLECAKKKNLVSGKDPWGIPAALIYLAGILTKTRVSQTELTLAADVSDRTIRIRYKELQSKLGDETIKLGFWFF